MPAPMYVFDKQLTQFHFQDLFVCLFAYKKIEDCKTLGVHIQSTLNLTFHTVILNRSNKKP